MQFAEIKSVNISEKKGTVKKPVETITLNSTGVQGDAHSGDWHRQVSLLGVESLKKAEAQNNMTFKYGDFAENITTEGFFLYKANIMDRFVSGNVVLEVTQIGKKCHKGCEIMKTTGDCVMPKEGIFCRVLKGGELKKGDKLEYHPKVLRVKVITVSDRASQGIYEDKSGPYAVKLLEKFFIESNRQYKITTEILSDDKKGLSEYIGNLKMENYDIIITTGGTGIGPRDNTPDAIAPLLDKQLPGIMELIRIKYGMEKPNALISRSVAGVMGTTLVYTLPGSVKAVEEYLSEILKTIEHSVRMLYGLNVH